MSEPTKQSHRVWFIRYINGGEHDSPMFDTAEEACVWAITEGYGDKHQARVCFYDTAEGRDDA